MSALFDEFREVPVFFMPRDALDQASQAQQALQPGKTGIICLQFTFSHSTVGTNSIGRASLSCTTHH